MSKSAQYGLVFFLLVIIILSLASIISFAPRGIDFVLFTVAGVLSIPACGAMILAIQAWVDEVEGRK